MTIRQNIFIIFFLIFLFFTKNQVATACIDLPEPNRFSITFFYPELSADTSYRMCYVDASYFRNWVYDMAPEARYKHNLVEWQQFFNNTPTLADLAAVIYNTNLETLQNEVLKGVLNGKPPGQAVRQNKFLSLLYTTKNTEALQYLVFAKQCEPYVQISMDYWDNPERDIDNMRQLAIQGKQYYEACNSPYLKLRYAFQIMRLEHYTGNFEACLEQYNQLVQPLLSNPELNNSVANGWILALKSGAQLRTGSIAQGMYGFASVFTHFPDSREIAFRNFSIENDDVWNETLSMAKTSEEKAVLWMLKGMQTNTLDLESLKQVTLLSPNWFGTEVLLIRQLNLLERYWLTPAITKPVELENKIDKSELTYPTEIETETETEQKGFWHSFRNFFARLFSFFRNLFSQSAPPIVADEMNYKELLATLQIITSEVAEQNKSNNPDLWYTAAAYTAFLDSNYRQCYRFLDKVSGANKKVQKQANLIYALARLSETQKPDADLENALVFALQGLPLPNDEYDNYSVTSRALTQMARAYLVNGNVSRAILFFDKAKETTAANILLDFYATQEDLDELARWVNTPKKTDADTFLLNNSRFTQPFIFDVKATKMMRKLEFAEALRWYNKIPPAYWTTINKEDSWSYEQYRYFTCHFNLNNETDLFEADTCHKYGFVQKVLALQEMANQNPQNAAPYYLQIANAFYNTPFWGYNGMVWQGTLVAALNYYKDYAPGHYPFNLPTLAQSIYNAELQFLNEYGTRHVAETYYQKVMDTATNPELAAEAAYWAALCKQEPLSTLHQGNYKDRTYLKMLKQQYGNTAFYKNKKLTCPGLADY
ncbi:MAG TPA: hypothetical protein PK239_12530 [Chitinophagales bacterium]|nr:hypothetical protein [Chitinophagales bacterium]